MNITFLPSQKLPQDETDIEIVEKKGIGHPDSLADSLADAISYAYSRYCLDKFGYVLHHNVDKINVLGGSSSAGFGFGNQVDPIRVIVNGRMSTCFGSEEIPVFAIAKEAVKQYLKKVIPEIDLEKGLKVFDFINKAGGPPHKGSRWFRPQSVEDLPEVKRPYAADTSCVIGYQPFSKVENLVISLHDYFYPNLYEKKYKYIGTDIKIMIVRVRKNINITMCVPFIGSLTPNIEFYKNEKQRIHNELLQLAVDSLGMEYKVNLDINTKDNPEKNDFYILAIGTAAESGDEGLVGRGNRSNGIIASHRPYSIEAAAGKNPVYHGGKVYDFMIKELSREIFDKTGKENVISVVSQNGGALDNPSELIIEINLGNNADNYKKIIEDATKSALEQMKKVTTGILAYHKPLYGFIDVNKIS